VSSETDLIQAVVANDLAGVEHALRGGADPNSVGDPALFRRNPALTIGAKDGSAEIVRLLLNAGASPNAEMSFEWTALRAAASGGHAGVVQMLLDAGADPNSARDRESIIRAAIDATRHRPGPLSERTVATLLESGARRTAREEPLVVGAVEHRAPPAVLRVLLAHGEDANQRRSDGTPILVIAAKRRDAAAVDVLIQHGANVDATDADGHTPLMHAVERGSDAIVTILLLGGASREVLAPDGNTAMLLARAWGESSIQFALGSHSVRPEKIEAHLSLVRLSPSRYRLRGDPSLFELWARIVDHTIDDLGESEFQTLVTEVETARSFAKRLRTEIPTFAADESWHSLEADASEVGVVRGCLLNLSYGPRMAMPDGLTKVEVIDMYEDLAGRY
jgi:ankyrin repeat protein